MPRRPLRNPPVQPPVQPPAIPPAPRHAIPLDADGYEAWAVLPHVVLDRYQATRMNGEVVRWNEIRRWWFRESDGENLLQAIRIHLRPPENMFGNLEDQQLLQQWRNARNPVGAAPPAPPAPAAIREVINPGEIPAAQAQANAFQQIFNVGVGQGLAGGDAPLPPIRFRMQAGPEGATPGEYLPCAERGSATPRFFINYESVEEYRLRLKGSIIMFKNSPIYVVEIYPNPAGRPDRIVATDVNGQNILIDLTKDLEGLNARAIQPGYIDTHELYGDPRNYSSAGYLYRIPSRIYRQGLCRDNSRIQVCGWNAPETSIANIATRSILNSIKDRATKKQFTRELVEQVSDYHHRQGLASKYLSANFAFVMDAQGAAIEFRSSKVADVVAGCIVADLRNRIPSSLHPEMEEINIL